MCDCSKDYCHHMNGQLWRGPQTLLFDSPGDLTLNQDRRVDFSDVFVFPGLIKYDQPLPRGDSEAPLALALAVVTAPEGSCPPPDPPTHRTIHKSTASTRTCIHTQYPHTHPPVLQPLFNQLQPAEPFPSLQSGRSIQYPSTYHDLLTSRCSSR